jgi:DNA-binding CsgD family transcriptional regulator
MKRTTTEKELRRWCEEGKSIEAIGDILGMSKSYVGAAKAVLGITAGPKGHRVGPAIDLNFVMQKMSENISPRETAKIIKVSLPTLLKQLKQAKLPCSLTQYWEYEAKRLQTLLTSKGEI